MTGFRQFQMISGSFWVVSVGFRWFQVVPRFSKYAFRETLIAKAFFLNSPKETKREQFEKRDMIP